MKWVLAGLLVLSVIGMGVAGSRIFGAPPPSRGPSAALVGQPAPPLDLPLVSGEGAQERDRIAIAGPTDRVTVLDFWASWCVPCRRSIPALNEIHDRYQSQVRILGVNVEAGLPRAALQQAHRDFGARFPSVQDERGDAQTAYHVYSIPTLVVIDRAGVVRWAQAGVPDPDEVADLLDTLLDEP